MDARHSLSERSYQRLRQIAVRLSSVATGYRASMDADIKVATLVNAHEGIDRVRTSLTNEYSPSVATVAVALHDVANDPGYDLLADMQALGLLLDDVQAELVTVIPISGDGSVQARTFDADGEVHIMVLAANLAPLRVAMDAMIAAILVN